MRDIAYALAALGVGGLVFAVVTYVGNRLADGYEAAQARQTTARIARGQG